jgi:hypothetical protein
VLGTYSNALPHALSLHGRIADAQVRSWNHTHTHAYIHT